MRCLYLRACFVCLVGFAFSAASWTHAEAKCVDHPLRVSPIATGEISAQQVFFIYGRGDAVADVKRLVGKGLEFIVREPGRATSVRVRGKVLAQQEHYPGITVAFMPERAFAPGSVVQLAEQPERSKRFDGDLWRVEPQAGLGPEWGLLFRLAPKIISSSDEQGIQVDLGTQVRSQVIFMMTLVDKRGKVLRIPVWAEPGASSLWLGLRRCSGLLRLHESDGPYQLSLEVFMGGALVPVASEPMQVLSSSPAGCY